MMQEIRKIRKGDGDEEISLCMDGVGYFWFNERRIDLSRKPLSSRMMRIFLQSKDLSASKEELLYRVFGIDIKHDMSSRLFTARRQNMWKFLSRLRVQLEEEFGDGDALSIKWLQMDREYDRWRLVSFES